MMTGFRNAFHILPVDESSVKFAKVISSKTGAKVMNVIYQEGDNVELSASEIAEKVDVSRTAVLHHIYRLQEGGYINVNPVLETYDMWNRFWE